MAALDRDRFELFVLDAKVDALLDFVAPPFIVRIDRLARFFVDQLLAKAIACLLVDLPKGDSLTRRRRCVERNRTRNERKFEIAFPVGARRGHRELLLNADKDPLITR